MELWRSLTCQNSDADISPVILMADLISMHCYQKMLHFLSVSDGPTSTLSCILITYGNHMNTFLWGIFEKWQILARDVLSQRRHRKDVFFEICSRRLKDVTHKISFLRCFWDALKASQKRHLFGDVFERSWRRLKKVISFEMFLGGFWDVSLNGEI